MADTLDTKINTAVREWREQLADTLEGQAEIPVGTVHSATYKDGWYDAFLLAAETVRRQP